MGGQSRGSPHFSWSYFMGGQIRGSLLLQVHLTLAGPILWVAVLEGVRSSLLWVAELERVHSKDCTYTTTLNEISNYVCATRIRARSVYNPVHAPEYQNKYWRGWVTRDPVC